MKRIILFCSILMLSILTGITTTARAESLVYIDSEKLTDYQTFQERLIELKSVDRSTLSHSEKKQLRKDIRQVHKQINGAKQGGGLLIAIAPLVVVVTLLIIFL